MTEPDYRQIVEPTRWLTTYQEARQMYQETTAQDRPPFWTQPPPISILRLPDGEEILRLRDDEFPKDKVNPMTEELLPPAPGRYKSATGTLFVVEGYDPAIDCVLGLIGDQYVQSPIEAFWDTYLPENNKSGNEGEVYDAKGTQLEEGFLVVLARNHEGSPYRVIGWNIDMVDGETGMYVGSLEVETENGEQEEFPLYYSDSDHLCSDDLIAYENGRIRNYGAMGYEKLTACISSFEEKKGDAYERCLRSGSGDPESDLEKCYEVLKSKFSS